MQAVGKLRKKLVQMWISLEKYEWPRLVCVNFLIIRACKTEYTGTSHFLVLCMSEECVCIIKWEVYVLMLGGVFALLFWTWMRDCILCSWRYVKNSNILLELSPGHLPVQLVGWEEPVAIGNCTEHLEHHSQFSVKNRSAISPFLHFLFQRETPLLMQYFPTEGHIDKMYFPYYGKKLHVSIITELNKSMPESELVLVRVVWLAQDVVPGKIMVLCS